MTILLKLGGSLITDKKQSKTFRRDVLSKIVIQLQNIREKYSDKKWIIGHGSGSFGHIEASKYDTINGVTSNEQWLGFTKVAYAASELSQLVWSEFIVSDLPVIRLHPSASLVSNHGNVEYFDTSTLRQYLDANLIPLVHGDVSLDTRLGGTIISTESLFQYIIKHINVEKIILLGEVDGVFNSEGQVITQITPKSFETIVDQLKGASGIDVTGGMYQKVYDMLQIVQFHPDLQIVIANGTKPDILHEILHPDNSIGTTITID